MLPGPVGARHAAWHLRHPAQVRGVARLWGDVLQVHDDGRAIFAIHRAWLGKPSERRLERLASPDPNDRRHVTNGCVNVMPDVYDRLTEARSLTVVP
jgi:hypothetical protein